jgi:hypothetical protein
VQKSIITTFFVEIMINFGRSIHNHLFEESKSIVGVGNKIFNCWA